MRIPILIVLGLLSGISGASAATYRCISYDYTTFARVKFDLTINPKEVSYFRFLGERDKIISEHRITRGITKDPFPLGKYVVQEKDFNAMISMETFFESNIARPEGDLILVGEKAIGILHFSCTSN